MGDIAKHSIKRQVLDITISNADDHEEVTTALSKICRENLDTVFGDICEGLVPPDEVLRFDSLTVDLGHLPLEGLANDFPKALVQAVRESLFVQIRDKKVALRPKGKAERQTKSEALLHYLATGQLPWYYEGNLEKLKQEFSNAGIDYTEYLLPIFKRRQSRKRAVHFFNEAVWNGFFLRENHPSDKKIPWFQLRTLKTCLQKLAARTSVLGVAPRQEAKALWSSLEHGETTYVFVVEALLLQWVEAPAQRVEGLFRFLPIPFRRRLQKLLSAVGPGESKGFSQEEKTLWAALGAPEELGPMALPPEAEPKVDKKADKDFGNREKRTKIDTAGEIQSLEDTTIENAGIILLWPYLQAFFTGMGLMEERAFKDEQSLVKAVHLLHYLAFKTEEGNETQWLLNKLLCGMGPTEFVPEKFDLKTSDKEECEHLLKAVITNWSALKNTGTDSLRTTFLQRSGVLEPCENGWKLKIERKAYDVLLDRLTWAISVIKMPWNEYLITTQW
ncbi:contractile injection system tape measure protein [Pseudozobellia thermophila]|uniref:Uncharacterized protein n=1 Tax=Pseudozobellia thermophila TaxID=192903 RepID=A0A1M6M676_9FLAO|nr:contractile injection system tape measure protein [Pseudozobellia thermophila]SHJ78966.1 hypothetical protein SAMN04488513_1096 [Pseudozobellia thermophila]